jgi:hypothetical protein
MKSKTNQVDFVDIRDRFNKFSEMENVKILQEVLLPKIRKYGIEMSELEKSVLECREAVLNIDGKMSLKLNKSEITAIKYEMTQTYLTRADYLTFENLFTDIKSKIVAMEIKQEDELQSTKIGLL